MAFHKPYTATTAGCIKLEQACVHHRVGIQQGYCTAQLTRNSLTQTQFEHLFFTSVISTLQLRDWLKPGALLRFEAPFVSVSLSLNCWQDCCVFGEDNLAVLWAAFSAQSQWDDTPLGQAGWMMPTLCPKPIHTASYITPEDKARPEVSPPPKIS